MAIGADFSGGAVGVAPGVTTVMGPAIGLKLKVSVNRRCVSVTGCVDGSRQRDQRTGSNTTTGKGSYNYEGTGGGRCEELDIKSTSFRS